LESLEGGSTALSHIYTPGATANSFSVSSSAGEEYSISRDVTLSLSASSDTTQMLISENADFAGASWEAYSTSKIFQLSSTEGTKTIYVKFRDTWYAESQVLSDTIRYIQEPKFVTRSAKKANEIKVTGKNITYFSKHFNFIFKTFPKKIKKSKYWLQSKVTTGKYPKSFVSPKKQIIKKYWKFTTNLNKYKVKKKSEKYKVKLAFSYTSKELKNLKNKKKSLKEKDLRLKYYNPKTHLWKNVKSLHNKKTNTFKVTIEHVDFATQYFVIGTK
jgi:hypothetical protein